MMPSTTRVTSAPPRRRLLAYVLTGILGGTLYVVFDLLSEERLRSGTLTGGFAHAHALIDHSFPILAGALLGLCSYQLRLQRRLRAAEEAASRAEALRLRLQKVERDQAVWVVAATVLHELNNPLHTLGLLLDEQAAASDDVEQSRELLARARAQTTRALSHLAALRSMKGVGEPEIGIVKLDRIVDALAEEAGTLAEADGIVVRVERAPSVEAAADANYVRTILENLLDNSLHSLREGAGGSLTIRLRSEAGRAIVEVSDDGPPLPNETRRTLFDPLRSTKTHGLGLGLPIARALARAMQGELSLDEGPSKSFRLELPGAHP